MTFPSEQLRTTGGRCYAHVFENPQGGVARNLFWSFTIDFAPVTLDEEGSEHNASATVEWVVLDIRDWRELAGLSLSGAYGDGGVESTFYVFAHHVASKFSLEIRDWREKKTPPEDPRRPVELLVALDLTVDYPGWDGDPDPELNVRGTAWIEFEGLIVSRDSLFPKPNSSDDARRVLQPFIDPDMFIEPATIKANWMPRILEAT